MFHLRTNPIVRLMQRMTKFGLLFKSAAEYGYGAELSVGAGRQIGRSLHELSNVAANRKELRCIHTPDDVADDGSQDPLDTSHSEAR